MDETGFDYFHNNYIAEKEITVTITLAEYRALVEYRAKSEMQIEALKSKLEVI